MEAIKPTTFIGKIPTFIKEKEADARGVSDEEQYLASMSRTAGWKVLSQYINQIIEEMDSINDLAIENGADFEQLGQNALVISQTKTVLRRILNKVKDAKESIDKT